MMKKIHFEQIVCASSQKSITTGYDGFGVRSKSGGISDMEADEIFYKSDINYQLPSEMMATEEIVAANPDLEKLYPSLYTFRSITLSSGETRYIIAKTLYVGIDYGYYAQIDAARRAGTNYVANILVFNEKPDVSVLSEVFNKKMFVPHDTICSPKNKELCSFLVGEPVALPDGDIEVEEKKNPSTDVDFGWLTIALLEMYKNEKILPPEQQKKVFFKIQHEKTEKILGLLGSLPDELTKDCFLQANSMLQSNVPDSFKLLIVNEKDNTTINEDYHIVIDLLGNTPRVVNVEIGDVYKQILDCCKGNEAKTLQKTVQLFLKLNFEETIDYSFLCLMMSLMYSSQGIGIKQLDVKTLKKITSCQLNEKATIVWNKINNAINGAFVEDYNPKDIQNALECIGYILHYHAGRLSVNDESRHFVVNLFFGKKQLGTIIADNPNRLEGGLCMVEPDNLPTETVFYDALKTSKNLSVWERFIRSYYGVNLVSNMDSIVLMILQSDVTYKDKETLVNTLFPVAQYADSWIDVINDNPVVVKTFPNLLTEYFETKMKDNHSDTMLKYLSIQKESRDLMKNVDKISAAYLIEVFYNTTYQDKDIMSKIIDKLSVKQSIEKRCKMFSLILNNHPLVSVDTNAMNYALKNCTDKEYLTELFKTWMKTKPERKDIVRYFKKVCNTSDLTAKTLEIVWDNYKSPEAKNVLISIKDEMDWSEDTREEIVSKLKDDELKELLSQKKSLIGRLMQMFFKNK